MKNQVVVVVQLADFMFNHSLLVLFKAVKS